MRESVFITGGTSGLGLALARLYDQAGFSVAVCGRDLTKLNPSERENFQCYEVDVTKSEDLIAAVDDFVARKGRLDIMIASAGRSVGSKSKVPRFDVAREVIAINVFGVINAFEAACKYMLPQKRGQLVAISSVAGFVGLPGASSYSASKAAVTIYCESLMLDLKDQGITTSVICPGFVDTPLTKKNNHSMPFLMSAEKAAVIMKKAVDQKQALTIFPWPMKLIITLLNKMPRRCYRFLMQLKLLNYSR